MIRRILPMQDKKKRGKADLAELCEMRSERG
jgi:hypothetical protein